MALQSLAGNFANLNPFKSVKLLAGTVRKKCSLNRQKKIKWAATVSELASQGQQDFSSGAQSISLLSFSVIATVSVNPSVR